MELRELLKSPETRNAKSALSRAKSVASPFFGATISPSLTSELNF